MINCVSAAVAFPAAMCWMLRTSAADVYDVVTPPGLTCVCQRPGLEMSSAKQAGASRRDSPSGQPAPAAGCAQTAPPIYSARFGPGLVRLPDQFCAGEVLRLAQGAPEGHPLSTRMTSGCHGL